MCSHCVHVAVYIVSFQEKKANQDSVGGEGDVDEGDDYIYIRMIHTYVCVDVCVCVFACVYMYIYTYNIGDDEEASGGQRIKRIKQGESRRLVEMDHLGLSLSLSLSLSLCFSNQICAKKKTAKNAHDDDSPQAKSKAPNGASKAPNGARH